MKALLSGLVVMMVGPCVAPTPPPRSQPTSPQAAVAAWSDAFNRDDTVQLRWLVHPDTREDFDRSPTLKADLEDWQVVRYDLGGPVKVDGRFDGREGTMHLGDGRRVEERPIVVIEAEGQWWVWRR